MDDQRQIKSGWFTFVVVSLFIVWPIANFAMFQSTWGTMANHFPELNDNASLRSFSAQIWLLLALSTVLQAVAGWRLVYHRKWQSVRFAIVAIWTAKVGFVAGKTLLFRYAFGDLTMNDRADVVGQFFLGAIVAGAWTLYFLKSKRVRALYERRID